MPSNQTANYNLSQWVKSDQVRMEDFNADNAKIDAAIKAVDNRLTTVAAGKASSSALSALQSTVTSQGGDLALRNCCFVTGSYQGTGTEGESSSVTLNFSHKPVFIRVNSTRDVRSICAVRGQETLFYFLSSGGVNKLAFTWGAKSVSWHGVNFDTRLSADTHLNNANTTYYYFAILEL